MIRNKTHILGIIFASCITFILIACNKQIETEYNRNPIDNFDALWETLDKRYCYFEAKNLNWNDIYSHYYQQVYDVKDEFQLFDLFAQMLDTLNDGHVNLYSSFDVSRCNGWFEDYPSNYNSDIVYGEKYFGDNYKIAGGIHYNTIHQGKIGLMRYSSFSSSISMRGMMYINAYFKDCDGIIIDVRNNGGGSLTNSERLAACFFKEKNVTGYTKHKTGDGHNDFSKASEIYTDPQLAFIDWSDKKIVVLCNRRCYSATNDFIVRMLNAPHATVIGGKTGGGGGLPLSQELPNGWMIRFSAAPMFDKHMKHTEFGVDPEKLINTSIEDEGKGLDTMIEEAINIIYSEN